MSNVQITAVKKIMAKHTKAGIRAIRCRNLNGSYNCEVALSSIDMTDSSVNFRTCDPHHVNKLVSKFNLSAVRNPILVFDNGRVKSVDGRHTLRTLLTMNQQGAHEGGFDIITADVFFDMTVEQAAALFHDLTQNSKRMDPWSAFHSGNVAGFPWAIKIKRAIAAAGFTTPVDEGVPPRTGANIKSIDPFKEAYEHSQTTGGHLVDELCTLIGAFHNQASGRFQKSAGTCSFMRGLLDILRTYRRHYSVEQILGWISRHSSEHYETLANDEARAGQTRRDRNHFRAAFESAVPKTFRVM